MKNVLTVIIMISKCKTHLLIQRSMDVILLKYKEVCSLFEIYDIQQVSHSAQLNKTNYRTSFIRREC